MSPALYQLSYSTMKRDMVGAARFELATFATQKRRATRLRYTPFFAQAFQPSVSPMSGARALAKQASKVPPADRIAGQGAFTQIFKDVPQQRILERHDVDFWLRIIGSPLPTSTSTTSDFKERSYWLEACS